MPRYILSRLLLALPTLLGVSVVVFMMVRALPGDPARVIAGLLASEADVERVRSQLGLDQPLVLQYSSFLLRLARLDLGVSARTAQPVLTEVAGRLPATFQLATTSILLATLVGIAAGVLAATHHNRRVDAVVSALILCGVSMPVYWLGLVLMGIFAIALRWLPAAGSQEPFSWVMPTATLALFSVAIIARMTRAAMLDVLHAEYVRTARMKGLGQSTVVYRHVLRNALLPVTTVVGLQFGALLGGAVLTETVFGWPGLGQLLVDALFARDYPVVQGIVLTFSLLFILVNLAVDVLYAYIDPRVRYG